MNIVLSSDLVRILFLGPRMKPRMCHWDTPKKLEAPVYKYFSDDIKVIKSRLCDMKKKIHIVQKGHTETHEQKYK